MSDSESLLHFKLLRFEISMLHFTFFLNQECLHLPSVAVAIADQTITCNCHRMARGKSLQRCRIYKRCLPVPADSGSAMPDARTMTVLCLLGRATLLPLPAHNVEVRVLFKAVDCNGRAAEITPVSKTVEATHFAAIPKYSNTTLS